MPEHPPSPLLYFFSFFLISVSHSRTPFSPLFPFVITIKEDNPIPEPPLQSIAGCLRNHTTFQKNKDI